MPQAQSILDVDVAAADTSNPVIQGTGQAIFGSGLYCTWNTDNGSVSMVKVANPGLANTLTFIVSGAPATITCNDPKNSTFNGVHTMPPNSPTSQIIATGDFGGQVVTITNFSNPSTTCQVQAQKAG